MPGKIFVCTALVLLAIVTLTTSQCFNGHPEPKLGGYAIVEGIILNAGADQLGVQLFKTPYLTTHLQSTAIDSTSKRQFFRFRVHLEGIQNGYLFTKNSTLHIVVSPLDSLWCTLDDSDSNIVLGISGKGSENALAWHHFQIGKEIVRRHEDEYYSVKEKLSRESYLEFIDSIKGIESSWVREQIIEKFNVHDSSFIELVNSATEYFYATHKLHAYEIGPSNCFIDSANLQNESAFILVEYLNFLAYYAPLVLRKKEEDSAGDLGNEIRLLRRHFVSPYFEYIAAGKVGALLLTMPDRFGPAYARFIEHAQVKTFIDYVTACYNEGSYRKVEMEAIEDSKEPPISFEKATDTAFCLEKFRGKVVLLEFWFSKCGACIAEIPHLKALQRKLADKPVEFVFVAVEQDENTWKSTIERHAMSGHHFLVKERNSPILKQFAVFSYPRYILIDKKGNLAKADAYRPSDSRLYEEITNLL